VFGSPRVTPAYYISLAVLIVGLVTGAALFVLLTANPEHAAAEITFRLPVPDRCPDGLHATVCYRVDVANAGASSVAGQCILSPAPGTTATFQNQDRVMAVTLGAGEARSIFVLVVPDGSVQTASPTVQAPTVNCASA
jgi:hypothetical protein